MKASWAFMALSPLFIAASFPTLAAGPLEKYEIRAAETTPDAPRLAEGARSVNVTLQVRVKVVGRFTGNVPTCEAGVDFGDGSPIERVTFGQAGGTSNVNNVPHAYSKPGTYTIKVAGTRSTLACEGRTSTEVTVLGPNDALPASGATKINAQGERVPVTAPATPRKRIDAEFDLDSVSIESSRSPCPPGWELVPKSDNAPYRFTCRPAPVKPLSCQGGTSFFENAGTIGCH